MTAEAGSLAAGDPQPGQRFGGYEIIELLGRGGMGRVFRAKHVTLEREVALKLLAEQFTHDEFYVQRFLKEARAAARVNHPNIVQIYDFGKEGEHFYLAMELVEGRSLLHFVKHWGRFSEVNAVAIARQALAALAVAHEASLVHRDVKPDNLILGKKGKVKLVDLGLAKKVSDDPGASHTGMAAGTPHYMAPEQIAGQPDIDGRADLYALGCTLYHLVTGQPPFSGSSSAMVMTNHLYSPRPDPRSLAPDLSGEFCRILAQLMARDRVDRYPSAEAADADFARLLERLVAGEAADPDSTRAPRPSSPPPVPRPTAAPRPGSDDDEALSSLHATAISSGAGASLASAWDPDVHRRLEEDLAGFVGPLAKVIVRRAARSASDFRDLAERVAVEIPDLESRSRFLSQALSPVPGAAPSRPSGPGGSGPGVGGGSGRSGAAAPATTRSHPSAGSSPSSAGGPAAFPPLALGQLEQALAAEIGPLARVLVKKEAKKAGGWDALVEGLVGQIPDGGGRDRFRRAAREIPR